MYRVIPSILPPRAPPVRRPPLAAGSGHGTPDAQAMLEGINRRRTGTQGAARPGPRALRLGRSAQYNVGSWGAYGAGPYWTRGVSHAVELPGLPRALGERLTSFPAGPSQPASASSPADRQPQDDAQGDQPPRWGSLRRTAYATSFETAFACASPVRSTGPGHLPSIGHAGAAPIRHPTASWIPRWQHIADRHPRVAVIDSVPGPEGGRVDGLRVRYATTEPIACACGKRITAYFAQRCPVIIGSFHQAPR